MSDDLDTLERDVETARARLVNNLERLRAPGTFAEVEGRVKDARTELVANAKQGMLDAVKSRIAANPAAALAVGAGLAWRLYRHPPVASVLVGAGLVSLLRTDPEHPGMGSGMGARVAGFAGSAQHRMEEWRASDPAGQAGDLADAARERVAGVAGNVRQKIEDYAETARERLDAVRVTTGQRAMPAIRRAAIRADRLTERGRRVASGVAADFGDRDKVLLGVAALALAAAVGVAAQRRQD